MRDGLVNAATATYEKVAAHSSAEECEATEALFSDGLVRRDLRRMPAPTANSRYELHRSAEGLTDVGFSEWKTTTLEVRGSSHALIQLSLSTESGFASEWLVVVECDATGRIAQLANFDLEDQEQARAELDRLSNP